MEYTDYVYCDRSWMLKYAEDFKYNPSLRNRVSQLRLAVEQEGEEEMLAMVDLDQWYVLTLTHARTHAHAHTHTQTCPHADLYTYMHTTLSFPTALGNVGNSRTVGAFLCFSIERLHQTWDKVPKAKKEVRNTQQSV